MVSQVESTHVPTRRKFMSYHKEFYYLRILLWKYTDASQFLFSQLIYVSEVPAERTNNGPSGSALTFEIRFNVLFSINERSVTLYVVNVNINSLQGQSYRRIPKVPLGLKIGRN